MRCSSVSFNNNGEGDDDDDDIYILRIQLKLNTALLSTVRVFVCVSQA